MYWHCYFGPCGTDCEAVTSYMHIYYINLQGKPSISAVFHLVSRLFLPPNLRTLHVVYCKRLNVTLSHRKWKRQQVG